MQETMRLLRGLQDLDKDLYRVKSELRRLPEEMNRRRERLATEEVRVAELDGRIREARSRIKEIEDLTTSQRQRMRKLENEATSARGDTALLVAFQHEMRSLKREISEAEEEGLGLVETAEGLEAERSQIQGTIDTAQEEFESYAGNVQKEIDAAEEKRKGLDAERSKRMGGPLAPEILTQYEKLLDAREGEAMALLEGRICQGCYVSVPNNIYVRLARGVELVLCPSCGRILYLPEL